MWSDYLATRVPLIRDKVLRAFAYDYAWTWWITDQGSAQVAQGKMQDPRTDPEFSPEANQRSTMSNYYAHELCYGEDAALIEG